MRVVCGLLTVVLLGCTGGEAGPFPTALQTTLDDWRTSNGVVGVTAALLSGRRGQVTLAGGSAELDPVRPMQPDTRFYVGSIAKTFTAAAVVQLVEAGALRFDDTLDQWFPDFPHADHITLQQMLNHTSGVVEYFNPSSPFVMLLLQDLQRSWTTDEVLTHVAQLKPTSDPGLGYGYSNANYLLLGRILERTTGRSLSSELERRFFAEHGLGATILVDGPSPSAKGKLTAMLSAAWAAGALVSNASDLATWVRALYGGNVLSETGRAAMLTPGSFPGKSGERYGLGVQFFETSAGQAVGHAGNLPGFASLTVYVLDRDIAVSVMSNDERAEVLLADLIDDLLNTALGN